MRRKKQGFIMILIFILIAAGLTFGNALPEAQSQTYTTACQSENEPITERVEGILIPATIDLYTNQAVNVNFYFHGLNWDGKDPKPLESYVQEMGLLTALTQQSPGNEIVVIFSGAKEHKTVANRWMAGKRANTPEAQFTCFYEEALNKIVGLGLNPVEVSLMGHSNGVHVIKNIIESGFLDEYHLPIKNIISFDGCYEEWCTDIAGELQGRITGRIYAYYLAGSAGTGANSKELKIKYPTSSVFEVTSVSHGNVPKECLFSHVLNDKCGGKAEPIIKIETRRSGGADATTAVSSSTTTAPLSAPTEAAPPLTPPETSLLARQIDEVWMKIRNWLGFTDPQRGIWNGGKWITFNSLYGPATSTISGKWDYSTLKFDQTAHLPALIAEAQAEGIDPCYALVVVSHETKGKSTVVGVDANVRGCKIESRRTLLLKMSENCKNQYGDDSKLKDACMSNVDPNFDSYNKPRSDTGNACLNDFLDTNAYKIIKPTKDNFCNNNYDNAYTYGIGLGQITPSAGSNSKTLDDGTSYTHCQLFDPQTNIKVTVALLKSNGAGLNQNVGEVTEVFRKYAGGLTPGVISRVSDYQRCTGQLVS